MPSEPPHVEPSAVPWLTVEEMREVDRVMTDELGITLEQMMENAGRSLAALARLLVGGDLRGARTLVLAGAGGNGGGGLAAARHLAVAGARVDVRLTRPAGSLSPVAQRQHEILVRAGVPTAVGATDLSDVDLVLDALLGYGQEGAPHGSLAELVEATGGRRVLALDVPSGLELSTGTLGRPHVRAEATLTLALPKRGLRARGAGESVGRLYLADISVPPCVYERLGHPHESPFGAGSIVRIADRDPT